MTTYEKIVKGATKLKVAAPKTKYIEPILMATSLAHDVASENFNTIMTTLAQRLQDSSWLVVYKLLIVIHIMIREGDRNVTLDYLSTRAPQMLNLSHAPITKHSGMNGDVRYVLKYGRYLYTRVKHYSDTHIDYVRDERVNNSTDQQGGRLRTLPVEKGLLRECESVQKQIDALLKNSFMEGEIKNDIMLTAFRLLVNDLLAFFQELNEGVINILEHYFEMFHNDAERALDVYKKFVDQTKYVIDYLRVAKHLEYATKLHVPTIKHAPTALTSSLEEYLNDPNFESNRRAYLQNKSPPFQVKQEQSKLEQNQQQPQQLQQQLLQQQQLQQQQQQQIQQQQIQQQQLQQQQLQQQQLQQQQLQQQQLQQQQLQQQQLQNQYQQSQATGLQRQGSLLVQQSTYNPWSSAVPTGFGFGQSAAHNPFSQQGYQPNQTGFQPQFTGFPSPAQQLPQQATGFQGMQNQGFQNGPNSAPSNASTQNTFGNSVQSFPSQSQNTGVNNPSLQKADTNPFSGLTSSVTVNPTNPFGNTRFANSHTTALSFDKDAPSKVSVTATGSNPFQVSQTTTNVFNNAAAQQQQQQQQQPVLKPQPTAGGLERLPTIPVFPQTQQEQARNGFLENAWMNLHNQTTSQQQQQQLQQQQQQQQFQQYPQQYPQQYQHVYNGPSLI